MTRHAGFTLVERPAVSKGFTLVELLVVITIIVVLISLLAPAMDRAIHEAEMAVCASNQHGIAAAQLAYASMFNRRYPHRAVVHDLSSLGVEHRQLTTPANRGQATNIQGYDDRPLLRPYLSINSLQCPKSGKVDLDTPDAFDTYVYGSYTRFAGWQYHFNTTTPINPLTPGAPGPAMLKMGDRWTFGDWGSRVMGGDLYLALGVFGWTFWASHPDGQELMMLQTQDKADASNPAGGDPDAKKTASQWTYYTGVTDQKSVPLKTVDANYHYDDGSVERFNALDWGVEGLTPGSRRDPRSRRVPGWNDLHIAGALIVPANR